MNDNEQQQRAIEDLRESADWIVRAFEPWTGTIQQTVRLMNKRFRPIARELQRQGVIDGYPPQYNYRQTKRGRVPRLSPAIRAKKREIRERRKR